MSRRTLACGLFAAALLAGCAGIPSEQLVRGSGKMAASVTAWNKYYIAGSRSPRALDAQGQPLTGSHVTTITDADLQSSAGILLADKLAGGYSR